MNHVTSCDGTRIAFDVRGSGHAVVLVDGALCSRAFGPMPKLAEHLAAHFTVYNYDRRGRGDSGDTAPYSVAREIEDIEALIEHAGGNVFLFGVSSGAALALRATAAELSIRKLAVFEPPWDVDETPAVTGAEHRERLHELLARNERGKTVNYFMRDMVDLPWFATIVMRLMPMWRKLEAVAHTIPYETHILGDMLPREMLGSIAVPTLTMAGGKSPSSMQRPAQVVAECVANGGGRGEFRVLKGQTHNCAADVLAPELIRFFQ